jgi:hypothetical protein
MRANAWSQIVVPLHLGAADTTNRMEFEIGHSNPNFFRMRESYTLVVVQRRGRRLTQNHVTKPSVRYARKKWTGRKSQIRKKKPNAWRSSFLLTFLRQGLRTRDYVLTPVPGSVDHENNFCQSSQLFSFFVFSQPSLLLSLIDFFFDRLPL